MWQIFNILRTRPPAPPLFSIGIDISDYTLEVLLVNSSKHVLAYERIPLSAGMVKDGIIIDTRAFVKKINPFLDAIKKKYNGADVRAVINVPEQSVFVHIFSVPAAETRTAAALETYLREQAVQLFPVEKRAFIGSYAFLPIPPGNKKPERYRALYAATDPEIIRSRAGICEDIGIPLTALELESSALARSLLVFAQEKDSVIIDGGTAGTNTAFFEISCLPIYSVSHRWGGEDITKAIAKRLRVSHNEAQKLKETFGASYTEAALKENTPAMQTSAVVREYLQGIFESVRDSILHYEKTTGRRAHTVYLAGGLALIPYAVPYASEILNRTVSLGDPLRHLLQSELPGKEKPSPVYAPVIGLALRGLEQNKETGIDLRGGGIMLTDTRPAWYTHWLFHKRALFFGIGIAAGVVLLVSALTAGFNTAQKKEPDAIIFDRAETEHPKESAANTGIRDAEFIVIKNTPTGWLNVRSGPDTSYEQISRVYPQEQYKIVDFVNNWYKIELPNNSFGWVLSTYTHIINL